MSLQRQLRSSMSARFLVRSLASHLRGSPTHLLFGDVSYSLSVSLDGPAISRDQLRDWSASAKSFESFGLMRIADLEAAVTRQVLDGTAVISAWQTIVTKTRHEEIEDDVVKNSVERLLEDSEKIQILRKAEQEFSRRREFLKAQTPAIHEALMNAMNSVFPLEIVGPN